MVDEELSTFLFFSLCFFSVGGRGRRRRGPVLGQKRREEKERKKNQVAKSQVWMHDLVLRALSSSCDGRVLVSLSEPIRGSCWIQEEYQEGNSFVNWQPD